LKDDDAKLKGLQHCAMPASCILYMIIVQSPLQRHVAEEIFVANKKQAERLHKIFIRYRGWLSCTYAFQHYLPYIGLGV